MNTYDPEQYILDAEKAFVDQEYLRGKELLENALIDEPTYGKAHNHMGWLYLYHLKDYEKAEAHLRLALKYSPGYGAAYEHMLSLLFEAKRLDEHKTLLERATQVPGVPNSFIYNDFGRNSEVRGRYREAVRFYRLGIRWSLDQQEITVMRENVRRCRSKRWQFLLG